MLICKFLTIQNRSFLPSRQRPSPQTTILTQLTSFRRTILKSTMVRLCLFAILTASALHRQYQPRGRQQDVPSAQSKIKSLSDVPQSSASFHGNYLSHQPLVLDQKVKTYLGDDRTNVQERSLPSSLPSQFLLSTSALTGVTMKEEGTYPRFTKIGQLLHFLLRQYRFRKLVRRRSWR